MGDGGGHHPDELVERPVGRRLPEAEVLADGGFQLNPEALQEGVEPPVGRHIKFSPVPSRFVGTCASSSGGGACDRHAPIVRQARAASSASSGSKVVPEVFERHRSPVMLNNLTAQSLPRSPPPVRSSAAQRSGSWEANKA